MENPIKDNLKKFVKGFDKRQIFFDNLKKPRRILELGCGYCDNCTLLKNNYPEAEIHGVDILRESEIPDFIIYKEVDLDKGILPYPDEFFDAVIFTHVIEHLRHPLNLGSEINRIMKKAASIYVETPNWTTIFIPSFGFRREQHGPFNFFDDPTHIKPWSKHGLFEFLFDACNLNVREVRTVRNWPKIPFDLFIIPLGLIGGKRAEVVSAFQNIYGWSIYGIADKKDK